MGKDELKQRVAEFYQARLSNDVQACMGFFAQQVVFAFTSSDGSAPIAHRSQAGDAVEALVSEVVATWRWLELRDQVILIDGNQAAVRYTVVVQFAPSGRRFHTQLMDHLVYDDAGQVVEFVEFADTALLNAMAADSGAKRALPES